MHKFFLLFGLSLVLTTGFQNKASAESNELVRVDVEFLSALIGPTKVNGNPWDSSAKINSTAMGLISDMIAPGSGVAASTVAAAVAQNAPKGVSAPDVIGYVVQKGPTVRDLVNIAGIAMTLAPNQTETRDSYTPRFYAGYQSWPMFPRTRFQVQLWDKDLADHDQIAVVEITYDQIMRAKEKGEPTWVNVADQSMNQLLYVLISVSPSIVNAPPKMNGYRWN